MMLKKFLQLILLIGLDIHFPNLKLIHEEKTRESLL